MLSNMDNIILITEVFYYVKKPVECVKERTDENFIPM